MIKVPYNKLELQIALLDVEKKFEDNKDALEKLVKNLDETYGDNSKKTSLIADHYGISVIDLINSPNYKTLVEEYDEILAKKIISSLCSDVGLDDIEAWGVITLLTGNLNL